MDIVLAADLGGTRMRAARCVGGAVVGLKVAPTPHDEGPEAFTDLLAAVGIGARRAVVGVPGRVDHKAGRVDYAPNLPASWLEGLSEQALSAALGIPVTLANDADLATIGEAQHGAGRGAEDLVYVTLSTGVGAGVLLRGKLARARRSLAEVGHHVLDLAAFDRGEPATWEELGSGTALARSGEPEALVAAAKAGEPGAARRVGAVVRAAAVGIRNLAYLYAPERVVIGGGLGLVLPGLCEAARAELARSGPRGMEVGVVLAELGDRAALFGAAGWEKLGR